MPQAQRTYDGYTRQVLQLERDADVHDADQQAEGLEATSACEAARQGLEADKRKLAEEVAKARLVLIGRNGIGKTTLIERWLLVGQASCAAQKSLHQAMVSRNHH